MTSEAAPEAVASAEDYSAAAGALLAEDAIRKIDAGARLTYALYHLPRDTVTALFKDASPGFIKAYDQATSAFGIER